MQSNPGAQGLSSLHESDQQTAVGSPVEESLPPPLVSSPVVAAISVEPVVASMGSPVLEPPPVVSASPVSLLPFASVPSDVLLDPSWVVPSPVLPSPVLLPGPLVVEGSRVSRPSLEQAGRDRRRNRSAKRVTLY